MAELMILYGILYSKSNSRRAVINRRTKRPMFIKSAGALKAMEDMVLQARAQWRKPPLEGDVDLIAGIFYPNRRHDLDDSLLCDILQKANVILNDRQIINKVLAKKFDKKNPRVELKLMGLGGI